MIGEINMLNLNKTVEGTKVKFDLEGRLDTITSPELEEAIQESVTDATELVLDFEKLEYISSSGLRVLLAAQKIMSKQGSMVVTNVNETIQEIFEVTGFSDILTIE